LLKRFFSLSLFLLLDEPQPRKTNGEDHHQDENGVLYHRSCPELMFTDQDCFRISLGLDLHQELLAFHDLDRQLEINQPCFAGGPPFTLRASPLRHPSHAHALIDTLALGNVDRVVTRSIDAQAAKGEVWIERKSHLRGGPCFIQMAEKRQSGSMLEMS
jgi:hypothetical protein